MLDMQNVKDIEITEGDVRTIHDKDNRLIWGRLAYDTKYAGNTTQNGEPTPDAPVTVNVVTGAQSVQVHGKNLCKAVSVSNNRRNLNFSIARPSSSTITLSATINVTLNGNSIYLNVDGTNYGAITTMSGTAGQLQKKTITFTEAQMQLIENATSITLFIYRSSGGLEAPTDGQIEEGSPATAYEPYQGATFTVDLGATELCKIDDYQDYIYKSGDDWYMYKAIGKAIFDGSETWSTSTSESGRWNVTGTGSAAGSSTTNYILSDKYIARYAVQNGSIFLSNNAGRISIVDTTHASLSDWKTWLGTNNVTVYFRLATPTDTKITDATLIGQLNAVHEWLTRYGYNATVTGNLPLIINQTNL